MPVTGSGGWRLPVVLDVFTGSTEHWPAPRWSVALDPWQLHGSCRFFSQSSAGSPYKDDSGDGGTRRRLRARIVGPALVEAHAVAASLSVLARLGHLGR